MLHHQLAEIDDLLRVRASPGAAVRPPDPPHRCPPSLDLRPVTESGDTVHSGRVGGNGFAIGADGGVYAPSPCPASSSPASCRRAGSIRSSPPDTRSCSATATSPGPPPTCAAAVADVDAVVCVLTDRIDADVLRAGAPRLKVVANVAVGYDNVDLATASELGIAVCNTPGVLDETTADLAFLLLLAAARRTSDAEADLRQGRWTGFHIGDFLGVDVHGAHARCRRLRPHRPGGRATRVGIRHGGAAPLAPRHRRSGLGGRPRRPVTTRRLRLAPRAPARRDARADRRPPARAR